MKRTAKAWLVFWVGFLGFLTGIAMFVTGIYYGWLSGTPGMEERADYLQDIGSVWGWLSWIMLGGGIIAIVVGIKLVNRCNAPDEE